MASYFISKNKQQKQPFDQQGTKDSQCQHLEGDHNKDDQDEKMTDKPTTDIQDESHSGSKVVKTKKDHATKLEAMPTWAATKSLLMSQSTSHHRLTNTEVITPLYKTSPTDYGTLYTVLALTQIISSVVVGPERKTIITLDLDLYSRALQIQQAVGNNNWVLRAGVLHIVFAALHSLGKTVDGSGIDTCAIESGIYTSTALWGVYNGKAYKRGVEYHITTCLA